MGLVSCKLTIVLRTGICLKQKRRILIVGVLLSSLYAWHSYPWGLRTCFGVQIILQGAILVCQFFT